MLKTGSAYYALAFGIATMFLITSSWPLEIITVCALVTGYFLGRSSPESQMNAEFAKHLSNSNFKTMKKNNPYEFMDRFNSLMPNDFDKMKRYNDNQEEE